MLLGSIFSAYIVFLGFLLIFVICGRGAEPSLKDLTHRDLAEQILAHLVCTVCEVI